MKTILTLIATLGLLLPGSLNPSILRASGLSADETPKTVYASTLLLNGHALDPLTFSIKTRGMLKLVIQDPALDELVKIPFRMYIQRGATVIPIGKKEAYETIDIYQALSRAIPGDKVVVEPVRPADVAAKRILYVGINWLTFLEPGC